ncbi:Transposable element Tcb2 transposase [Vespula maculifrons]|uniref:Transposable element Tcb2 transposase n=1 Tax=Vespula maculifrons TaxID=7453 RepID=A0ABD2D2R8_VESMC
MKKNIVADIIKRYKKDNCIEFRSKKKYNESGKIISAETMHTVMRNNGYNDRIFRKSIVWRRKNLQKSVTKKSIQNSSKFYHDNELKYKAWIVQEYLLYNCPKVLHPLPQSSNLNPIKNL